ncbi:spx domain-containing protein [Diplodia corticola]|uniref:Spx domain-containing protein n=1 Tax=Diplodia corticola TaxID=236234 RepID=A0A1J9R3Y0_9PEZI|nr:spx domain-containing protein [Diplodia corticola]OJD36158.1 spx domain-containing protein [Diplodia corticola]
MKYGDTLRQRSIPQWGPYNLDYDEIKHLIKEHTTPGNGKAVSIPGQPDVNRRQFEDQLFEILSDEHRRIDLFVRSKSGEIERRLNHVTKQINQFTLRERATSPGDRNISERRRQKYGKIEGDVLRAGEEVRSLARFVGAQRLAFAKLLKKYKKWTHSDSLEQRFKQEVLSQPGTFSQTDVAPLMNYWSDTLHAVRTAYQAGQAPDTPRIALSDENLVESAGSTDLKAVPSRIHAAAETANEVDLDTALATLPLGPSGARATYWVHTEQIVEIQILLLQTLRLFEGKLAKSQPTSPFETPKRRDSSERLDGLNDRADSVGTIFIDDSERYAKQRSATTVEDAEETPGKPATRVLGSARWNAAGDAAVCVPCEFEPASSGASVCTKLKRKHLSDFLTLDRPFHARRASGLSPIQENASQSDVSGRDPVDDLRAWLLTHKDFDPIAGLSAKRSRFVGMDNDSDHGVWAVLDREIYLKTPDLSDLVESDWPKKMRRDATAFPFAVLEVRYEGAQTNDLIRTLDHSHLTERIRGFSLEAHAIWTCCKPSSMQPPYWLPTLERDIRKVPAAVPKHSSRCGSGIPHLEAGSSRQTSVSNSSVTDGQTSRYTTLHGGSSATSMNDIEPSTLSASKKPRRSNLRDFAMNEDQESRTNIQGYWNEYDNPEDGEDEDAYVIYVDPYESIKLPGQETISKLIGKLKKAIGSRRRPSEHDSLLASPTANSVEDSDDGEPSSSARSWNHGYGTMPDNANNAHGSGKSHRPDRRNRLLDLFRPRDSVTETRWSYRPSPVQTLGANPSDLNELLADLEQRRAEREATKFRLCMTSLAASVMVLLITWTLAATSRRKLRREVNVMVVVGVVANLVFAIMGVLCAVSKRQSLGLIAGLCVAAVVSAVCIADGGLLVWLLS